MILIALIINFVLFPLNENYDKSTVITTDKEIAEVVSMNETGILWCFRCKCVQGSGYCMVRHYPATVGCEGGNFEGSCEHCSLELYRSDGPCVDGGF